MTATFDFGAAFELEPVFCVGVCVGVVSVRRWRSVGVAGRLHGQVGLTEANAAAAAPET